VSDPRERLVSVRPRTVLSTAGVLVALALGLWSVYAARQVLAWMLVSAFLAVALDPAVGWLQRRARIRGRRAAASIVFASALVAVVGIGFLVVPPIVHQVTRLAGAVPGYVDEIEHGRGPLGFLQTRYHVADKLRSALEGGAAGRLAGGASRVLSVTRSLVSAVVAMVTIAFLTLFMTLEGPTWIERLYATLPPVSERRWRAVGRRVAAAVSGYVTGNLLISVIAGAASALVMFLVGAPFPLVLGLLVAVLDLIPLAGATVAGIVLTAVAALTSITAAIVVVVFFVLYQQVENHVLQPLVYGRTVELSPLTVLISVLIGAELAGILGTLAAIPVAGTLQILLADWHEHRRRPLRRAGADGGTRPRLTARS
jgi:predicted PurR-regulated permease PerM